MSANELPPPTSHLNPIKPDTQKGLAGAETAISGIGSTGGDDVILPIEALTAGARIGNGAFQFIKLVLIIGARGMIVPAEVILRTGFGERYFDFYTSLCFYAIVLTLGGTGFLRPIPAISIFLIGTAGMAVHNWRCFFRDRIGEYWHSYFEGESRYRYKKADEFLAQLFFTMDFSKLILEPALVLACALPLIVMSFVFRFSTIVWETGIGQLGYYLGIMGVAMFGYQYYCYQVRREATLDEKDAMIVVQAKDLARQPVQESSLKNFRGVAYLPSGGVRRWKS